MPSKEKKKRKTMNKKKILRGISLGMLLVAVIFVFCALSNPELGKAVYIGNFRFGAKEWRIGYAFYALLMLGLFAASFFVREKK